MTPKTQQSQQGLEDCEEVPPHSWDNPSLLIPDTVDTWQHE